MKFLKKYSPAIFLIITLIIGAFFRFSKLGSSPSGLYVDESSIGYSAFSVLKTGKDEYGKTLPILFRSFSTFQSPVYTYITVPFIYLFGLSPFSTRLPSALFGTLSIILIYFIAKPLFLESNNNGDTKKITIDAELFAQFAAFFMAISPWHIQYSRTAYESNIALFFLLLGSLLFFYALRRPWLFTFSFVFYGISLNSYRAEILIVPILIFALIINYKNKIFLQIKNFIPPLISSCLLLLLITIPVIRVLQTPGFRVRSDSMNIFSSNPQNAWGYKTGIDKIFSFTNNPKLLSVKEFFSLYTSYFSPRYLFFLGDSGPRKAYPSIGTFFSWQLPLLLIGLYVLLKNKNQKSLRVFIFTLLLVSPIPASLTRDPYSTLRSLPMVVPLLLIISLGLLYIFQSLLPLLNKTKYLVLTFIVFLSILKIYISIFYHHDYFRSVYWNYGWEQAISKLPNLDPKLPILVDNSHGDTYIEILFFLKYNPATYQQDNFEVSASEYYTNLNRNTTKKIGRFTVKSFQWGVDTDHTNQYIIADNITIGKVQIKEHNLSVIDEIYYPNGEIALRILKTNPKI